VKVKVIVKVEGREGEGGGVKVGSEGEGGGLGATDRQST
jgi:hypothetical protein